MNGKDLQEQLNDSSKSLIEVYFDIQKHFEEKYGKNTVILIEVGSFFEVYGVDNEEMKIGKPKEIAEILNLQLTRKNKSIEINDIKNPLLAGFPTATFDRYINRLVQEKKYTIVIIRQKGQPPFIQRYIDKILSPGINFDYTQNSSDNYITSIIIDKSNDIYSSGYSALDVTTGKTALFEVYGTKDDPTFALDELFSLLQTYTTSEILLTLRADDLYTEEILDYLELTHEKNVQIQKKHLDIAYQNELFQKTYIIQSFLSPIEFLDLERKPLTSESLAILLEFIIEHDYHVIQKLGKPTILDNKTFMYLGNNPLEQLNIISKDPHETTLLQIMDNTSTSIGRRLLKDRLMNPILHKEELERRYNFSDALEPLAEKIDESLKNIYDLERISRRIRIGRLHPFEINFLYESLISTKSIFEHIQQLQTDTLLPECVSLLPNVQNAITSIENTFQLEESTKVNFQTINTSIFLFGFDRELDELLIQKQKAEEKLETIRTSIIELIQKTTGKNEESFVTIKQMDKEGHSICMTKSRYYLIEEVFQKSSFTLDNIAYPFSQFKKKIQTGNVKITSDIIDNISEDIVLLQNKIIAITKSLFLNELEQIDQKFHQLLENIIRGISQIDVALSNVKASKRYRLTRPEIVQTEDNETLLEIEALRHPLVEIREERGIYIPNDICIGNRKLFSKKGYATTLAQMTEEDIRGVLLYGINSSGKSSLMKSIGVAVILAQSGMYVPANSMRFGIFHEIFTRIIAKDNLEKGLSSFAVEMMELKNIFGRCTPKSLILGDEISHGTETLSAIAIVSATIERLSQIGSVFLFTTHLHQLHNLDILQKLKEVVSVHLSVKYDEKNDILIFDRILQPGSGSSIYGLEFAESLHMDSQFLKLATDIRKNLSHNYEDLELLTKKQTSKYNNKVFLTNCAVCGSSVEDTHHISPQQLADSSGHIDHFHKDHKYNLLPLCKNCHERVHTKKLTIHGFVMTDKGLKLNFEEQ
ncbi:MAG: DNA mismatch repair protein [Candidatus Magasanikbacteria bacterium]